MTTLVSPSLFETNLAALQTHSPETAQKVLQAGFDGFPVEVVPTKTAAPTVRITPPGGGKPVLLHSAYDPIREAMRWAEGIELTEPTNVIILGVGLGYHLLSVLQRHEKNIRFLFLIEQDPRILRLALSAFELRRIITRDGTHWIVGEEPEAIPDQIGEKRIDIILHNCKILPHEPSMRYSPAYYNRVRESILDALTYDEINLRTTFENQGRNQFNIFMNLPAIFQSYAPKDCRDLFRGFPAVVAAAGPSLDKNIDRLRDLNDRAVLFIVDTAQTSFRKRRIAPHWIVTGDPTPLNFSHFEKIDSLGEAFLAFHPEVNREITQKFVNHPNLFPMFDTESALLEYLFQIEEEYGTIERAMNVGHLAFNLALHMGCAPIILVGFDFAFPRKGGTTHAKDAALSRATDPMLDDGTVTIGGKEGKACAESGKMMLVPGYYGEPVPTTVPFSQYIKALERNVAELDFEVIDATEGGAAKEGTLRMTLREALDKTLRAGGVSERLDAFRQKRRTPDLEVLLSRLQKGREVLAHSRAIGDSMWNMLQEWRVLLSRGPIEPHEAARRWTEFDRLWIQIVSEPLFDAFLGSAVQYLYFRRQRAVQLPEETGTSFLQSMYEKYEFIISEMNALLDHFIRCVELSILSLQTMFKDEKRP